MGKVYHHITNEIIEKAGKYDSLINYKNRRKIFTVLPNNPFNKKGGVCFTGASLELAVDEVVSNSLTGLWKIKNDQRKYDLVRDIIKIIKAHVYDHLHFGLLEGHKRSKAHMITTWDVNNYSHHYDYFFIEYNEVNDQYGIYSYETDSPEYKDQWLEGYLDEVIEN